MATNSRPNQRPGKLSSKFGAAFAAFENNSGESNVPQAFRSAAMRKKPTTTTTKLNVGSKSSFKPRETSEETPKTSLSQYDTDQESGINADGVSDKPEQSTQSEQAARNGAELIQSAPNPTPSPVKRNFKVSSKLSNRTKIMFESPSNNKGLSTTGTAAYMNARQGLRKVKNQTTVERSAQGTTESTSSKPTSDKQMELFMKNVAETKKAVGIIDDELVEVDEEEEEYYLEKDYSDDDYDEVWEEETLDSTEDEGDEWTFQSWDEETIEDGLVVEEEEISVGV